MDKFVDCVALVLFSALLSIVPVVFLGRDTFSEFAFYGALWGLASYGFLRFILLWPSIIWDDDTPPERINFWVAVISLSLPIAFVVVVIAIVLAFLAYYGWQFLKQVALFGEEFFNVPSFAVFETSLAVFVFSFVLFGFAMGATSPWWHLSSAILTGIAFLFFYNVGKIGMDIDDEGGSALERAEAVESPKKIFSLACGGVLVFLAVLAAAFIDFAVWTCSRIKTGK